MKKKLVMIMLAMGLFITGCYKAQKNEQSQKAIKQPDNHTRLALKDGGEDDDDPIIMEITKDINGVPLGNAQIILINGRDTIIGVTTAQNGCTLVLPVSGDWDLSITKQNYIPIHTVVNIVDSFTLKVDTLIEIQ